MDQIIAYKSDDGTLHEEKVKAIEADAAYWKKIALQPRTEIEEDHEPGYHLDRGGHQ